MQQVTWRADDALVERVRSVAAAEGRSMNDFISRVLDAGTDPSAAGSDAARIRERLARAGLLVVPTPVASRPDADAVAAAGRRAARGSSVSEIVSRERG